MNKTEISKQFVKQHGEYSCGLACLASITNYYGGSITQQELMRSSGTTLNGTSMLGLVPGSHKRLVLRPGDFEAANISFKRVERSGYTSCSH
jgi:ABC-type bacteriocin/lantibiotic exporter with double-glycine peptidase domain